MAAKDVQTWEDYIQARARPVGRSRLGRDKMKTWWQRWVRRIMEWAGNQQGFYFVRAKFDQDGKAIAMHFAISERAMNISMREFVEILDK